MFHNPKPETITRIAARRRAEQNERHASFQHYYRAARALYPELPLLESLPEDKNHAWFELADGRAVSIGANGFREE